MANEATVNCGLSIRKGNFSYTTPVSSFRADVSEGKGPTPGFVTITTDGVDIDISKIDSPGLASITNMDDTNYFDWGIKDTSTGHFFVVARVLAGESYPIRFSPYLQGEFTGTGTGTASGSGGTLHAKAYGGSCNARFDINDT